MKWFRLYSSVLHDPKVQQLSPALFKHWINLLCLASETDDNGRLPDRKAIAFALRVYPGQADKILAQLSQATLIELDNDSKFYIHKWESRQSRSDDVARRVRDFRERQNPSESRDQGYMNSGHVTLHVTDEKRYGNVLEEEGEEEERYEERLDTKKKGGMRREGRAATRVPPPSSNNFSPQSIPLQLDTARLPEAVLQQFHPDQLHKEWEKAREWASKSPSRMLTYDFFVQNWLTKIKPEDIVSPNESKIDRLKRHLARFTPEKVVVDGKTYARVAEELRNARQEEADERARAHREAFARWEETLVVYPRQEDPSPE
jgi:hypothetical protein